MELDTSKGFTEVQLESWLDEVTKNTDKSRKSVRITVDGDTGNLIANV